MIVHKGAAKLLMNDLSKHCSKHICGNRIKFLARGLCESYFMYNKKGYIWSMNRYDLKDYKFKTSKKRFLDMAYSFLKQNSIMKKVMRLKPLVNEMVKIGEKHDPFRFIAQGHPKDEYDCCVYQTLVHFTRRRSKAACLKQINMSFCSCSGLGPNARTKRVASELYNFYMKHEELTDEIELFKLAVGRYY